MLEARTRHGSCELGGGVLICGGLDALDSELASAEMYWPETQIRIPIADMPAARFDHGMACFGDKAIAFTGRATAPAGALDSDVLSFDLHTGAWSSAAGGPAFSAYATAQLGTLVFFVGGEDVGGTAQTEVFAWNLTTGKMVAGQLGVLSVGIKFAEAVGLTEDILLSGPDTSLRAMKSRPVGDVGPALTPMETIDGVTITDGSAQMPVATWEGKAYLYNPARQEVWCFDPETRSTSVVATGTPERYGASIHVKHGRMFLFGGGPVSLDLTGSDSVDAIELNAHVLEAPNSPANFSTELRAQSVGFIAGQTYGAVIHDPWTSADHIRLSTG
jgi:hypothetical protein